MLRKILAATCFERGPQHGNICDTVVEEKEHRLLAKGTKKSSSSSVINVFIVAWKRSGIAVPLNVNVVGVGNK